MAIFLAATLVDVLDAPQTPKRISYLHGASGDEPLKPTATKGVYEAELPEGRDEVTLIVSHPKFFPVKQVIKVDRSKAQPTVSYGATQHLNVRGVPTVHSRATTDFVIEVDVVLGQLRDNSKDVEPFTTTGGGLHRFTLGPQKVRRYATPMVDPEGRGFKSLKSTEVDADPMGPVFFIERVDYPRFLVAIDPGWPADPEGDPEKFPLHFHINFPPTTPAEFGNLYPYDDAYFDFPSRYTVLPYAYEKTDDEARPRGKQGAYQNVVKSNNSIFVFPVADPNHQLGGLHSQAAIMRLLYELSYFYQRMRGSKMARRKVGNLGVSGFSNGVANITPLMSGNNAAFLKALRLVCLLDGVGSEAANLNGPAVAWQKGGENRHLRVYTQFGEWVAMVNKYPNAVVTNGKDGAREWEAPGFTMVYLPLTFWQVEKPEYGTYHVPHQIFPAYFLEHGVSSSQP